MIKKAIQYIKTLEEKFHRWHSNQDLIDSTSGDYKRMSQDIEKAISRLK